MGNGGLLVNAPLPIEEPGEAAMSETIPRIVTAEDARQLADDFLADEVGDLLMAEDGRLIYDRGPRWEFAVTLGNAVRGHLGRVGMVRVDAATGTVCLNSDERERILVNAARATLSSTP